MADKGRRSIGSLLRGLAVVAVALGCGETDFPEPEERTAGKDLLEIYVVNHPLETFAMRIGGERVRVVLPAPPDVDPAFWQPGPEIVADYQRADLVLENGAGYAGWLQYASLLRARRVDTSAGFRERWIEQGNGVTHGHGPAGAHTHPRTAFTTWLDPQLALEQARAVAVAMIERRPDEAAAFRAGLEEIESSLRALDIRLAAALRALAGQPVLFSHPVYQYLARRYALKGRSLHWEPGVLPDPVQWRELEAMLESHPARWMLYEGAPHPDTVSRLARLGVRVIVFAPGANRSPNRDWLTLMNENASRLEAALRNEPVGAGRGG